MTVLCANTAGSDGKGKQRGSEYTPFQTKNQMLLNGGTRHRLLYSQENNKK